MRELPFAVFGLVSQPTLEDLGAVAFESGTDAHGLAQQSVSVGYTFWRNPEGRDDPVNLAELDETTRASLDVDPPWPRPRWLLESVERMRYPMLSEAVRTSWGRGQSNYTTLEYQLVHHTNHILMNHFREELGLPPGAVGEGNWRASASSVNPEASVLVNGVRTSAAEIDTDPFVYAVGVRLDPQLVVTAVVAREYLPYVRIELVTREPEPA
jgi:hypothetical protein